MATIGAPTSANYVDRILTGLARHPDRIAFHVPMGAPLTYADVSELVHRMAHVLADHGVGPDVTVTFLSGNRADSLVARYAANLLGARVVFLYEGIAADVQATILSDVDTQLLVVDPRLAERADRILELSPVPTVFTLGPAGVGSDLLAMADAAPSSTVPARPVSLADPWCIRHTGGTTGHPKGVLMVHGGQLGMLTAIADTLGPEPVFLACTTLSHMAGMVSDGVLASGGTIVLHDHFDAARVLADIPRFGVTQLALLPPLLYRLLDDPAIDTTDTSSLEGIGYGGCVAAPTRIAEAVERFGPILYQVYGQNECGSVITILTAADHLRPELLGTVGRPVPGIEVAIRDDTGTDVEPGHHGEICVRSPMASKGYWRNPELTAQVWRDGWVRTGDVGYLDAEGYLHVIDRLKDMIVVVGGHVYPTEVEETLLLHPAIAQAAVYGVRDTDATEGVCAALVLHPGHELSLADVRGYVETKMGAMYAPHRITVLDRIPLTDAGKPDKKFLRANSSADVLDHGRQSAVR